jgi:hypothetical protein
MSELRERDAMICRSCGQEERASEGYPCKDCGTFICIMCVFKGVVRCERCDAMATRGNAPAAGAMHPIASAGTPQAPPDMDWPEH